MGRRISKLLLATEPIVNLNDLRQVEQDVNYPGAKPSFGIQAPCSLAAKGGWVETPRPQVSGRAVHGSQLAVRGRVWAAVRRLSQQNSESTQRNFCSGSLVSGR